MTFKRRAANHQIPHHFLHGPALASMIANVPHRGRDFRVFDRQNIGRLSDGNSLRSDQDWCFGWRIAGHHAVESGSPFIAELKCVLLDAAQWRSRETTDNFVIIDAKHCNLVRDRQIGTRTSRENLTPANVITRKHGNGVRQCFQPVNDLRFRQFTAGLLNTEIGDRRAAPGNPKDGHVVTARVEIGDEMLATLIRETDSRVAAVREMAKSTTEEVLRGQLGECVGIRAERGTTGSRMRLRKSTTGRRKRATLRAILSLLMREMTPSPFHGFTTLGTSSVRLFSKCKICHAPWLRI